MVILCGSLLGDGSEEAALFQALASFLVPESPAFGFAEGPSTQRNWFVSESGKAARRRVFSHNSRLDFLRANEASLEKRHPTHADQQAEQEPTVESDESARSSASTAQNPLSLRREE